MKFKKWVHWHQLTNISLKERPRDVCQFLQNNGYMDDDAYPTNIAISQKLARIKEDKVEWNKIRYLSLSRDARRAKFQKK